MHKYITVHIHGVNAHWGWFLRLNDHFGGWKHVVRDETRCQTISCVCVWEEGRVSRTHMCAHIARGGVSQVHVCVSGAVKWWKLPLSVLPV